MFIIFIILYYIMIKKISLILISFNFSLILVLISLIFVFGVIDFGFNPLVDAAENDLGLSSTGHAMTHINKAMLVVSQIPSSIDWFFLAVFLTMMVDILYLSIMSYRQSVWTYLSSVLIGIPLFIWILDILNGLINSIIISLSSMIVEMPSLPVFSYVSNNMVTVGAILCVLSVSINIVDWQMVRNRILPKKEVEEDLEFFEE